MNSIAMVARAILYSLIAVGIAAATACSSDHEASEARNVGTVTIPLLTQVGGSTYRLQAVFAISGAQGLVTLATNGDGSVLSTTLPTGPYVAFLQSFTLSKDDGGESFHDVPATVVSNNQAFTIFAHSTTSISFQFETEGVIVPLGSGNLSIGFGVTELPGRCNPITVDPQARTVQSHGFFLDFSNSVSENPEDLDVLRWAGGPNLAQSFAVDACTSGVVEHFGNSWVPPDPNIGGRVLVGSGTTGSWEQDGDSIVIRSKSSGCAQSTSIPVETRYRFREGLGANTIEVERQFDLGSAPLSVSFRPFIPRLLVAFDRVLHPDAAGATLISEDVFACPFGCQLSDWDGSWFAHYASSGPFAGQGMIVRRQQSTLPAYLWIDNDAGATATNTSSVLLWPPAGGFPPRISEKELLCFFDAESWSAAEQGALTLPAGCTLDLECNAAESGPPSACQPNPCQHGAACVEMGDGYACDCPEGIGGHDCELPFTSFSVGFGDGCGIRADGTLKYWGLNASGQELAQAGTFLAVSMGREQCCAIRSDGTLVCPGSDNSSVATPPGGEFSAVSTGTLHACAIRSDHTLACWGDNTFGQATPPSGTFAAIASGESFSCGLRTDGTLACWGSNSAGQATPPTGTYASVTTGARHACALAASGAAVCWGSNASGEAGPPGGAFTAIHGGMDLTCGERTDGTLACWGAAAGVPTGAFAEVELSRSLSDTGCVRGFDDSIACWGVLAGFHPPGGAFRQVVVRPRTTCRLRLDGTIVCDNATPPSGVFQALGAGTDDTLCAVRDDQTLACWNGAPTPPTGTFTAVAVSSMNVCGLGTDHSLHCAGDDTYGESSPPAGAYESVGLGNAYGCALATDQTVACWGQPMEGLPPPAGTFSQLSVGLVHACAVATGGSLTCWGHGNAGEAVPPSGTFTSVTAGWVHNCAVRTDGSVVCWGAGSGTPASGADLPPPGTFTALATSENVTCGLRPDHTDECWGHRVR